MHLIRVRVHVEYDDFHICRHACDRAECDCGFVGPCRETGNAARLDKYRHQVAAGDRQPPQRHKSSRPRDGRKRKVYAAENSVFPINVPQFHDITAVQAELERWKRTAWFKARYPRPELISVDFNTGRGSFAQGSRIKLGKAQYNRYVLAHELAHVFTLHHREAAHGKKFCGTYIALVARFIGKPEADALRAAFVAAKIPHRYAVPIVRKRRSVSALPTTKAASAVTKFLPL